jgi:hypothetical protein
MDYLPFTHSLHQEHLQELHKIKIMAHFARINEYNIVEEVLVVDNSEEHRGEKFLSIDLGLGGRWIQTSYNDNFRKQYAGVGFYYDEDKDIFIGIQPYPSWTLDENSDWQPPIPKPDDSIYWTWEEPSLNWIKVLYE